MTFSRADMLAAATSSLAAAGARDRDGWVGLFASGGRVEDPVGSQPHRGRMAIRRFYDTFIGPRDIVTHPDVDIVVGSTVIRDLSLEVGMISGLTLRIPAYLRYDLQDDNGDLKIAALYAFWELPTMAGQLLRSGPRSVPAGLLLSKGLLTNQGLIGTLGFLSGFRGAGPAGQAALQRVPDRRAGRRRGRGAAAVDEESAHHNRRRRSVDHQRAADKARGCPPPQADRRRLSPGHRAGSRRAPRCARCRGRHEALCDQKDSLLLRSRVTV